ncbi:hypothetical protein XCR_2220 [Xanthomonas campestris pv. raphani 756C]|nr:hypothetical protein XCR_2220 [Xanthomonas campestris pv. raphani 756C]
MPGASAGGAIKLAVAAAEMNNGDAVGTFSAFQYFFLFLA